MDASTLQGLQQAIIELQQQKRPRKWIKIIPLKD